MTVDFSFYIPNRNLFNKFILCLLDADTESLCNLFDIKNLVRCNKLLQVPASDPVEDFIPWKENVILQLKPQFTNLSLQQFKLSIQEILKNVAELCCIKKTEYIWVP